MAGKDPKRPKNDDLILDFFQTASEPQGLSDVVEATGIKYNVVRQSLPLLVEKGRLERVEHGLYRLALPQATVEGRSYVLDVIGIKPDTHIAQYEEMPDIPRHLLARAFVQPHVDQSLQPSGDGFLADRVEVVMRVGTTDAKRTEMPTDGFAGYIERGAPIEVIPCSDFAGEGVYFLLLDRRTTVARVQPIGGRGFRLSYDNPSYLPLVLIPVEGDNTYEEPESGLISTLEFVGRIEGSFRRH